MLNTVREFCDQHGDDSTYWVAYSGGLDSHVLLHLFSRIRAEKPLQLKAVHIHHGLSPHADAWRRHCLEQCQQLEIEFHSCTIQVDLTKGHSPEELARQLRYEKLMSFLEEKDLLLTAHHQDDQAETVLLQLLRGSGPKGLAAMPRLKQLPKGMQARPLLNFTRQELHLYAKEQGLTWIEDESNYDGQFTRNFLRSDILPVLKKRWPTITETLARVAENCSATQQFLDDMLKEELNSVRGHTPKTLAVKHLLQYPFPKQSLLLRAWLSELNFPLPSKVKLEEILNQCLHAGEDKMPAVTWRDVEVRRFQNELYALKILPEVDAEKIYPWNVLEAEELTITHCGTLQAIPKQGDGLLLKGNITVRFRQGGEKVFLHGCHHTLKNLFHEWRIPYWLRSRIPLIYQNEELVAIPGFYLSDSYRASNHQIGYLFKAVYEFDTPCIQHHGNDDDVRVGKCKDISPEPQMLKSE